MHDCKIISGKNLSHKLLDELQHKVTLLKNEGKPLPGLAVVLVGDNEASKVYVNNKKAACHKIGFNSYEHKLTALASEQELLELIDKLNHDNLVDGILVQLPLPKHIDANKVINAIHPSKDVDGFHRYNIGSLAVGDANLAPCTPRGVIYMLDSIGFEYKGCHAVVLGTSNIVGRPMMLELINRRATVTICNSQTRDIKSITALADVLIVAVGKPGLVNRDWVKPSAVVIDVGINRMDDGKLQGDIDFDSVKEVASYITPVPGGVGPLTIAMLMQNTLNCYLTHRALRL